MIAAPMHRARGRVRWPALRARFGLAYFYGKVGIARAALAIRRAKVRLDT
jgi:hypothetical protein